jgi:excisionase family DNA binding protein
MEQKLYTLQEVADLFRVSPRTVMNWEKRGKITFVYLPIGNMIRITGDEVDRIMATVQTCRLVE